jgi:hypothetical protein
VVDFLPPAVEAIATRLGLLDASDNLDPAFFDHPLASVRGMLVYPRRRLVEDSAVEGVSVLPTSLSANPRRAAPLRCRRCAHFCCLTCSNSPTPGHPWMPEARGPPHRESWCRPPGRTPARRARWPGKVHQGPARALWTVGRYRSQPLGCRHPPVSHRRLAAGVFR